MMIHQVICLDFKRTYLPDNLIMAVSVFLKTFSGTTRKCHILALVLTLKALEASMGMNHTKWKRIS